MYDVIIIGGGPAGASAALFCAKAGKQTLVVDADQSITKRAWIENHYGVMAVTGPELIETGKKQAIQFGAKFVIGKAQNVVSTDEGLRVQLESESFEAKHVILATGVASDMAETMGLETLPATEPRMKTRIVVDAQGRTAKKNIWAAGTIAGCSVHTIITAGDGARVAINVISELNGERYVDHDVLK